jgi:hypothetical protein
MINGKTFPKNLKAINHSIADYLGLLYLSEGLNFLIYFVFAENGFDIEIMFANTAYP